MDKIIWINEKTVDIYNQLIIEGTITIRGWYYIMSDYIKNKGLLITGIDAKENEFSEIMNKILLNHSIPFKIIEDCFWIENIFVQSFFEKTEFGDSLDSCFFLSDINIIKNYKNDWTEKIIFKNKKDAGIAKLFMKTDDIFISYKDIPDLIIISMDAKTIQLNKQQIKNIFG